MSTSSRDPSIHAATVAGVGASQTRELLPLAYGQLRAIARSMLQRERPGHSFQPTALVHEACLALLRQRQQPRDVAHLRAVAAIMMRRILTRHATRRRTLKCGGGRLRLTLDAAVNWCDEQGVDVIGLNDALERLAAFAPRQARIVELRFYGGMAMEEIAAVIGAAERTVHREWSSARAWLRAEIGGRGVP